MEDTCIEPVFRNRKPKHQRIHIRRRSQGPEQGPMYLKLLSTPKPSALLKLKQKKSLFFNAILTAKNYFGAPTKSCKSDFFDLLKYVGSIFQYEVNINKQDIYEKTKELPKPNSFVLVNIRQVYLYRPIRLHRGDSLFCLIGTNSNFLTRTKTVDASSQPRWNEEYLICRSTSNDISLVVELFVKPKMGRPYSLGKATKDFDVIPDNKPLNLLLTEDNDLAKSVDSFMGVKCSFQGEKPVAKLNAIYRHILMCYLVFEHYLSELGNSPCKMGEANEDSVYGLGLGRILGNNALTFLHQHAVQSGLTPYENVMCCFLVTNQGFLKTSKIGLDVVLTILESMTLMGSWPQKSLNHILRMTTVSELDTTVECCAYILHKLPEKLQQNENKALDQLRNVVMFLYHVEEFYLPDVVKNIMDYMEHGARFDHVQLNELNTMEVKLTEAVLRKVMSELQCIIDVLWKADSQINQQTYWNITYTSMVYKSLDANLSESLVSLMTRLTVESTTLPHKGVNYQMQIFGLVSELISVIVHGVPGLSEEQMNLTNCLNVVKHEAFVSYMRLVTDRHNTSILSWVENVGISKENQFLTYTRDLLQEWKKLFDVRPISPTVAMLKVFAEKCVTLIKRLKDNVRRIISCNMRNNKQLVNDSLHYLRKIRDIVICIDIVTSEMKKYGIDLAADVKKQMRKLQIEPALRDIVENLEVNPSSPDFVDFFDEHGVEDNLHIKLINYFCL